MNNDPSRLSETHETLILDRFKKETNQVDIYKKKMLSRNLNLALPDKCSELVIQSLKLEILHGKVEVLLNKKIKKLNLIFQIYNLIS